jgi:galactose mutarotase-like enzyme
VAQTGDSVTLELLAGPLTRPSYPFEFRHRLTYRLVAGRLEMVQTVDNLDSRPLPFSTGIHPYFAVPTDPGARAKCFVRLPRCQRFNPIGQCETYFTEPVPSQEWPVCRDVSTALFFGNFAEPELALVDPTAGTEFVVNFSDSPAYRFAALWSRTGDSPFYCLEPWTALPNSFGRPDGELTILPPGGRFSAQISFDVRAV